MHHLRKHMTALELWMAPFFAKAPHLSPGIRKTLTDIAPWLALIFGILGLFGLLSAGMFGTLLSFSYFGTIASLVMAIGIVLSIISAGLSILAFQPLRSVQKHGWNLLFYGNVLSAVSLVLNLLFGYGYSNLGSVLGMLIGFWLLFEIRQMYK